MTMCNIFPPPAPELAATTAYVLAGAAVIVGAGLLLWGRILGRAVITVAFASAGWFLGEYVAQWLNVPQMLAKLVILICGAALGLVLSTIVWTLLGAALLGALAAAAVAVSKSPSLPQAAQDGWDTWLGSAYEIAVAAWQTDRLMLVLIPGAAAAVPLIAAIFSRRLVQLVTTALVGATAVVAGGLLAATQFRTRAWEDAFAHWYVPVGLAGGLTLLGLIVQGRAALARRKEKEKQPAGEKAKSKPADKGGKEQPKG